MPIVEPGSLVLVTGGSGFVGSHTVKALLESGFRVRITARTPEKITRAAAQFPEYMGLIEAVTVPEISVPGAFDHAVLGVDAIVHLASPVDHFSSDDPKVLIDQAVAGVVNLLVSAAKYAPSVRRVVQISSIAAVGPANAPPGTHFTEKDWNETAIKVCEAEGAAAHSFHKYGASKTLAECAFWGFFDDKDVAFDGVALQPSFNIGPPLGVLEEGRGAQSSLSLLLPWLMPGYPGDITRPLAGLVDVRDVAMVIIRALITPRAAGERYILNAVPLVGNDIALAVNQIAFEPGIVRGNPDPAFRAKMANKATYHDGSKARRTFGFEYRDKDSTLLEAISLLREQLLRAEEANLTGGQWATATGPRNGYNQCQ